MLLLINYKSRLLAPVALLALGLWLGAQVVSSVDSDFKDQMKKVFGDDPEMIDLIGKYMELVPGSHKARSSASRLLAECTCKAKKKAESAMENTKQHKSVATYRSPVLDTISIFMQGHESSEDCECPECPPQVKNPKCIECPKDEPCKRDSCPPCPVPEECRPPLPGQKCPPKPVCKVCKSDKNLGKSVNVTGIGELPPLGDILGQATSLMSRSTKFEKMEKAQREHKEHREHSSSAHSTSLHELNKPNINAITPPPATSTTTKKPSAVTTKLPSAPSTTRRPFPPIFNYPSDSPFYYKVTWKPPVDTTNPTWPFRNMPTPKPPRPPRPPRPVRTKTSTTKKPATTTTTTKKATTTTTKKATTTTTKKATTTTKKATTTTAKPKVVATTKKVNGNGQVVTKVTTTTTTTTTTTVTKFSGCALYEKNMNMIKNETLREQLRAMIDKIPENAGGMEMVMARRVLMRFGENVTTITNTKTRGSNRAATYHTSKFNIKSILGHILEHRRRKECKCAPCPVRKECKKCPVPKVCPKSKKCDPCPSQPKCPAPKGCPVYPPCKKCEPPRTYYDYNGPTDELDDIDSENPVSKAELNRQHNCKEKTCPFVTTCGNATLNPLSPKTTGYINGGEDEVYGEWPSFVRLDVQMPDGTKGLCGGVLISDKHVLTAGHCIRTPKEGDKDGVYVDAKYFTVHLADHTKEEKDKYEVVTKVKEICRSSKFNDPKGEGSRYDFAVLTLNQTVKFNDHIQPACLPYKKIPLKSDKDGLKRQHCYVVGLGVMKYSEIGNHEFAKVVQKMRVDRVTCKDWGFKNDDRSRYCWTKHEGKGDSCGGDSGGPILCLSPRTKRWTVMGLVSYGSTACDGTERSAWTGVYTRVPALLDQMALDCKI